MTSAIIDLLAVEAVFLTAFTGIISASMWHKTHIDSEMAAGESFSRPRWGGGPEDLKRIHGHG